MVEHQNEFIKFGNGHKKATLILQCPKPHMMKVPILSLKTLKKTELKVSVLSHSKHTRDITTIKSQHIVVYSHCIAALPLPFFSLCFTSDCSGQKKQKKSTSWNTCTAGERPIARPTSRPFDRGATFSLGFRDHKQSFGGVDVQIPRKAAENWSLIHAGFASPGDF